MKHLFVTISLIAITAPAAAESPRAVVADAAEQQRGAAVRSAVEKGAHVDAAQADGTTALHWAVYHNDTDLALWLLERGADASLANDYSARPLTLACENANRQLVEALVKSGADANAPATGGETPLHVAARAGRTAPVAALLKHGAKVDATQRSGQTPLMFAAAEGHADVVRLLIKHGADPDKSLGSGFTPMMFAARQGHGEVVQALLGLGVDVDAVMESKGRGKAPRNGTSALILAVENGHFELAIDLIDAGADPNDQRSGYAPLHALTWVRKPNRGDGADGEPAPIGSGRMTSLQFAESLIERGADPDLRLRRGPSGRGKLNLKGASPLLMAAKTADLPYMKLLLKHGANPKGVNADGATPLMAAAGVGTIAPTEEAGTEDEALLAVQLLLKLGADINHVDKNGETAMHGAAYKSLPKMVRLLADNGADIDTWFTKNRYGWNPVMIAEGHRVGNFKPSIDTLQALHQVLVDAGIDPPPPTPRKKRKGY